MHALHRNSVYSQLALVSNVEIACQCLYSQAFDIPIQLNISNFKRKDIIIHHHVSKEVANLSLYYNNRCMAIWKSFLVATSVLQSFQVCKICGCHDFKQHNIKYIVRCIIQKHHACIQQLYCIIYKKYYEQDITFVAS